MALSGTVNSLLSCVSLRFMLTYKPLSCMCFQRTNVQNFNYFRSSILKYTTVSKPQCKKQEYEVTFVKANGERIKAKGKEGDTLLDVVVNNNLDFDGYGACEGTLTCSTCHVILKKQDYDRLPDKPSDEELDMLDLAYDLTDTSRLGCQIHLTKDLHGLEVRVPATVNDARS
ncbi:adrenodoxin-like protein 2, mitochondrial Ferredoxin 2 [Lycorma delicatula]|uniref:adrenodoxin-like protein 2, mitochondrial Ferredoxin 2 n=1 Tax=Lycorma delicatula TaxID=130591 RepID=UPI003F514E24